MKTKIIFFFLLIFSGISFYSCNDDDHSAPSASVNDFVWKSMNLWYYWQSNVADLSDNRFQSDSEYTSFLNSKQTPDLFYGLLYEYGNTDRFSWIVDDYRQLQNEFANVKLSFGMKYGLVYVSQNSDEIFGYVQYVLPNSPASIAGLKRGDIFTKVNGVQLDDSNYTSLLSGNTISFGMGYIENGEIYNDNEEHTLTKIEIKENPVLINKVFETNGHKIGYLMYNAFRANYNLELNQAVAELKSQGITDLIIDLRYNGGGSVQTCSYFGSMISGQFNDMNFTNLTFNSKRSDFNSVYKFENQAKSYDDNLNENGSFELTHLNMNKIFVLTLSGTASASEMLINSMRPYIEVTTVGRQTYGKTVGSITLYDSPSTQYTSSDNGINTSHYWALQPIVFDSKNSMNQPSPVMGISPDFDISEISYLENLPPLGSENDPLVAKAISQITGNPLQPLNLTPFNQGKMFKSSSELEKYGTEMYLEKGFQFNW